LLSFLKADSARSDLGVRLQGRSDLGVVAVLLNELVGW
jgi:hypothetical protein